LIDDDEELSSVLDSDEAMLSSPLGSDALQAIDEF
jgi:hypothetical protein